MSSEFESEFSFPKSKNKPSGTQAERRNSDASMAHSIGVERVATTQGNGRTALQSNCRGDKESGIKDGIRTQWYAEFDLATPASDRSLARRCRPEWRRRGAIRKSGEWSGQGHFEIGLGSGR
jgi:hypothetical protein